MAEIPNRNTQGNANAVPEEIKWVTEEEAEVLDKLLFKSFNRKDGKDKSKFFYKVVGSHPFVPTHHNGEMITTATGNNLIRFEVRKFYRNEFIEVKRREAGVEHEEKVNKPVEWVEVDDMGNGRVLDKDANFFMEAREFQVKFERDKE